MGNFKQFQQAMFVERHPIHLTQHEMRMIAQALDCHSGCMAHAFAAMAEDAELGDMSEEDKQLCAGYGLKAKHLRHMAGRMAYFASSLKENAEAKFDIDVDKLDAMFN